MRTTSLPLFGLTAILAVFPMGCRPDPSDASLGENVGSAFSTCNPAEIKFLASKHNLSLAFRECGNNTFSTFSWSPDGLHVYFQLLMSGYVMNADAPNKATLTVPVPQPVGRAAWLSNRRVAIPVVGPEGQEQQLRLALFDLPPKTEPGEPQGGAGLFYVELGAFDEITTVSAGRTPTEVLFLGKAPDTEPTLYKVDTGTGTVSKAFEWLDGSPTDFSFTPRQGALALSMDDGVQLRKASDGSTLGTWSHAQRGTLHPDGSWLALEHEAAPVSIFYQRAWDEMSENARRREQARAKQFEASLPEGYVKEVRPPTLSVVDMKSGERWEFTSFLGHDFQWYEAYDYYASFLLWGFEGKQFKRNVALGNLSDRLGAIRDGRERIGMRKFEPPEPAAADADHDPDASTDTPAAPREP